MSSSEPPYPYFCKIISEDTIGLNQFRFPRKFVRKHGSELQSPVQLTVPDGVTFHVEVAKYNDGEVWLENGWKQFSQHYSLKEGYVLMFEYERNCSFQVLPFDMIGAPETDYPYISDSDDSGDEECQQATIKVKEEVVAEEEEAKDNSEGLEACKGKGRDMGNGRECPQGVILKVLGLTTKEKAETQRIANSFNSKNPFFLSVIQPCNVRNHYRMSIPNEFAKKFLANKPEAGGKAILCLSDGQSWSVKYHYDCKGYHEKYPRARFTSGWKKFALDNGLVAGDICLFELLEGAEAEMTLKVVVHRVAYVAKCDTLE